jgi:hypothetical protein
MRKCENPNCFEDTCRGECGDSRLKRFVVVTLLATFILVMGGCKSLPGNLEVDTPFFDIEYEGAKEG